MARVVDIKIVADTRDFRRALMQAEHRLTHSRWRRLLLRIALWRIEREDAP